MPPRLMETCGFLPRRSPRRAFRPILSPLEPRALLSSLPSAPTADEQYMLQLINRARANPPAEGQRLLALAKTDPTLRDAVKGRDLSAFLKQISAIGPLPPLAFNTRLIAAARDQDAVMLAANDQKHAPSGFLVNPDLGRVAADGQPYYPVGTSSWATGENLFAYSGNVASSSLKDYVDYYEAGLTIDWGNPDFGHLKNLFAPGPSQVKAGGQLPFSEIGIGLLADASPTTPPPANPDFLANRGLNVGPVLLTQEFGYRSGDAFLTGAVYRDADSNAFYTPGEGLGNVQVQAAGLNGEGIYETVTWDSGGYSLALPPGTYSVTIAGTGAPSRTSTVTIGQDNVGWDVSYDNGAVADQPVPGDYDGDGKTDVAVYRASTAQWLINGSGTGPRAVTFGEPNMDVPVPGDYDGDGKTDIAVYRPSTGQWLILGSTAGPMTVNFGTPGLDSPVPADYDGDGKTDEAVYRPTQGVWFVRTPDGQAHGTAFGQAGVDVPVPADYDGDGKADLAVFRPTTAEWLILGSNSPGRIVQFGQPGVDAPVPADYDGDHRADPAVYRPTTAQWFVQGTTSGFRETSFGQAGADVPVPGDFDGDHRADPAVYRPASAQWFELRTRDGLSSVSFGQGGRGRLATTLPRSSIANFGTLSTRWTTDPADDPAPVPEVSTPQGPVVKVSRAERRRRIKAVIHRPLARRRK